MAHYGLKIGFAIDADPITPLLPEIAYRTAQTYLFQPVSSKYLTERFGGGTDYYHDVFGPTHLYVDPNAGTAWQTPGGDWLDGALVRQGSTPWFSVACDTAGTAEYTADVTALVSEVELLGKPLAILLSKSAGAGYVVSPFDGSVAAPSIDVTYINGATATLACRMVALNNASNTAVDSTSARILLPVFVEFEQPTDVVSSATLTVNIEKAGSTSGNLQGMLLDPAQWSGGPVSTPGIAEDLGPLDAGASAHPNVLLSMQMLDSAVLGDFVSSDTGSYSSEVNYDPVLFGGASDTSKWPTSLGGKFLSGAGTNVTLVTSAELGETALSSGVGALRFRLEADPGAIDGGTWDNSGTLGADAKLMLPVSQFGNLEHARVRYYQMLGSPYDPQPSDRKNIDATGTEMWSTLGGKFGLGFDCSNTYGGGSGSGGSGGGDGWQLRDYWKACDSDIAGPARGGVYQGVHWYDYQSKNPAGHRYGTEQTTAWGQWGQQGLRGSMLYAGKMQCIEKEIILNTLTDLGGGSYSYAADGEYRVWVDDVLAYEQTGLVFRTGVNTYVYDPSKLRPCRTLGITGFWMNLFHGGQSPNPVQLDYYITQIIVSDGARIGPMRPAYASWRVTGGATAAIGISKLSDLAPLNMDWKVTSGSNMPWAVGGTVGVQPMSDITADCGNAYDYETDTFYGGPGGGHSAICIPVPYAYPTDSAQYIYLDTPLPSDGFAAMIDAGRGAASPANLAATYSTGQIDTINGEWIASWPSWDVQPDRTGTPSKRQKETHHTGNSLLHIPASACGNSQGILLMPAGSGGATAGYEGSRAMFDLDRGQIIHTLNTYPWGVYYGGSCYAGGGVNRVFVEAAGGTNPRTNYMYVLHPQERRYRVAVCGDTFTGADNGSWIMDGGPIWHEPSGLILKFVAYNPATGVEAPGYNSTSSAYHVYAVRPEDVVASAEEAGADYHWTKLTVDIGAVSWPTMQFRSGGVGNITWTCNPLTGKVSALNGDNNQTTIWDLIPPTGYTTTATALSDTWTLTTRAVSPGIPEGNNGASGYSWFVYNRLRYSRRQRCYVYESSHVGQGPIAISE